MPAGYSRSLRNDSTSEAETPGVPSAFITQMADLDWSLSLSIHPRAYTICFPSGEICGLETLSISK